MTRLQLAAMELGDDVQYVDDELMHQQCAEQDADADRRMAKRKQACPSCYLIHAGECM